MPTFHFKGPDGKTYHITGPDGATPEQAFGMLQQQMGNSQSSDGVEPGPAGGSGQPPASPEPAAAATPAQPAPVAPKPQPAPHTPWGPEGSTLRAIQNVLATPEGGFDSPTLNNLAHGTGLAAGMLTKGVTGTAGLAGDALAATGNLAGGHFGMPSQQIANAFPQPQGAAEKIADFGGTMLAGGMGDPLARAMSNNLTQPQARPPSVREMSVQDARGAGYVLPPSQGNGSLVGRVAEKVAGADNTAKAAQLRNQATTNQLAKRALGMSDSENLDRDVVDNLIKQTYTAGYDPVRQAGPMTTGSVYRKALDKVLKEHSAGSPSFPDAADPSVQRLVDSFRVKGFDSNDAVDAIQALRKQAGQAYAQGNSNLAQAHNKIATALENNIELNLNSRAPGVGSETLDAFKSARTNLAKQYQVQRALNPATGDVNALKLASTFQRKPGLLTDELAQIGRAGTLSKSALKTPEGGMPAEAPNLLRTLVGGIAGGPHGAMAATAAPFGKMGVRAGLLSGPGQRAFVDPQLDPSAISKMLADPRLYKSLPAGFSNLFNDGASQ